MQRAWGSPPPPRLRTGPKHVGAARGPRCPGSRGGPGCGFARGRGGGPLAHATHTPLPRVEARAEVSQGSEDKARPRLALGEVSGSLFYSASPLIAGGDGSRTEGGNSGPGGGSPRGTGKRRVAPAVAVAATGVGAPGPTARWPGRSGARILPAGSGAGAAGPCPVPRRAGPAPCAPGAVPARGLRLCLPRGGWGGGGRGSRSGSTPSAAAGSGFCSLAGGRSGGGTHEHRRSPAAPMPSWVLQRNDLEKAARLSLCLPRRRLWCRRGALPGAAPLPALRAAKGR